MTKNKSERVYDTAWRDRVCTRFRRIYVIVMAALVPTLLGTMGWAVTQHNDALLALPFTLVGLFFLSLFLYGIVPEKFERAAYRKSALYIRARLGADESFGPELFSRREFVIRISPEKHKIYLQRGYFDGGCIVDHAAVTGVEAVCDTHYEDADHTSVRIGVSVKTREGEISVLPYGDKYSTWFMNTFMSEMIAVRDAAMECAARLGKELEEWRKREEAAAANDRSAASEADDDEAGSASLPGDDDERGSAAGSAGQAGEEDIRSKD